MAKGEAKNIECKVLDTIHEQTYERGGGYHLRVVSWVIDGKVHKPSFEKRETWIDDSGNQRSGKAKGFNEFDTRMFIKHLPRICKIMGIPPQILAEEVQSSLGATDSAPQAELLPATGEKDPW